MTQIHRGIFYEHKEYGWDHVSYCLFNNDPFFECQGGIVNERLIKWKPGDVLRIYNNNKIIKQIQIHNIDDVYQNPVELTLDFCRTLADYNTKIELIDTPFATSTSDPTQQHDCEHDHCDNCDNCHDNNYHVINNMMVCGTLCYVRHWLNYSPYVCKSQNFNMGSNFLPRYHVIRNGNVLKIKDWHGNVFWENTIEWVPVSEEEKKLWNLFIDIYPRGMSPLVWNKIHLIKPQIELCTNPKT